MLDDERLKNPRVGNTYFGSQAERRVPMTMRDWTVKVEGFLTLNDREILQNAGRVSAELAKAHAKREFVEFRRAEDRRLESDFDRAVKRLPSHSDRIRSVRSGPGGSPRFATAPCELYSELYSQLY